MHINVIGIDRGVRQRGAWEKSPKNSRFFYWYNNHKSIKSSRRLARESSDGGNLNGIGVAWPRQTELCGRQLKRQLWRRWRRQSGGKWRGGDGNGKDQC